MNTTFRLGPVFRRSFEIYYRNIIPFTVIMLILYSPVIIYSALIMQPGMTEADKQTLQLVQFGGELFLGFAATGALTFGTFEQLRGRKPSMRDSIVFGLHRMPAVLLVGLVMVSGIFLGLFLFVVPGLILACVWWVALPVEIVEKRGVLGSLNRSAELTRGYRWQAFAAMLLLFSVAALISMMMQPPEKANAEDLQIYMYAHFASGIVISTFSAVVSCVAYHDLRAAKEGMTSADLADVFD